MVKVSIAAPVLLETEYRPHIRAAARTCCSVKPSICRQQQPAVRVLPVQGRAEKMVEDRLTAPILVHLEYGTSFTGTSVERRAIKRPIPASNQGSGRILSR